MKKDTYKKLNTISLVDEVKKRFKKSSMRCMIFGNFGAMNLGDEAILAGELQELKKIKNLNIKIVSRYPNEIKKHHATSSISIYNLLGIFNELLKSDFVIVGGGGLICKADRGFLSVAYQFYMLFLFLLLPIILKKKVFAIGLGIYDNSNKYILGAVVHLLRSTDLLTVRDEHSYSFLKSKKLNPKLYKDNSFLMDLYDEKDIRKISFFKKNMDINKKNIGLALTKPSGKKEEELLVSSLLSFVSDKYQNSIFWFYSCDFQSGYENDYIYSKKINALLKSRFGKKFKAYFVPTSYSPAIFFSSFKLMDHFFTMRLHASIFAYRSKKNFIGVSYDKKCTSFFKQIGKSSIVLENDGIDKRSKLIKEYLFDIIIWIRRFMYISLGLLDTIKSGKSQVFVITYHSVADDKWRFSVDLDKIKRQLTFLKNNYDFITLNTLELFIKGEIEITKPSVVITFDDGYRDVLKLKSFFKKNNIRPAVFILANPRRANYKELGTKREFLNRNEILSLKNDGWEIGSHTNTHADLTTLSEQRLKDEILDSRKKLEEIIKTDVKYFAYPRGKYTDKVLKILKKSGYVLGLTMDDGFISKKTNPLLVPRIGVDRTHSFQEFKSLNSINNVNMRMRIKQSFVGRYI